MNQSQFQQAAGISAGLSARWFPHIDAAMKEFGITAVNDQAMFIAHSEILRRPVRLDRRFLQAQARQTC